MSSDLDDVDVNFNNINIMDNINTIDEIIIDININDFIDFVKNTLDSVPLLNIALTLSQSILQAAQGVNSNQRALKKLCEYAALFVKSLAEQSRNNASLSDSLQTNIDSVNNLFKRIKTFVEKESAKNFLLKYMCYFKTVNKIQQLYKQISQLAQSLQVAVAFDTNSITRAIQNDTKELMQMMLEIKNSNEAMNAKMNEMLSDAKLQNQKLETLESIAETIRSDMMSLPDQIRDIMREMLPMAQERIEKSAGRRLSPRFDWTINPDDVNIDWNAKIGQGGYGTIYKAVYRNKRVVVKVIDQTHVNQQAADDIEKEASIWYPLRDPNILLLWGVCLNVEKPFLVMPMMKSDLSRYIITHSDLDMQARIKIIMSIANGMKYLHSRASPIVHGDLKANNVLVGFDDEICITDFGLAFIKTASKANTKSQTHAARWVAPEKYKKGYKLVPSADVFAFAMTCIEIITGMPPFPEEHQDCVITQWIMQGDRPDRPENVPGYLWSLIEDCWHQEPDKRPSFNKIVGMLMNPINFPAQPDSNAVLVELKPVQPGPSQSSLKTVVGSTDHLEPNKESNLSHTRTPSLNSASKTTIKMSSSHGIDELLREQLSNLKVPKATLIDIDNDIPEAYKEAISIISMGKLASDPCWNVVGRLYEKMTNFGNLGAYFELAWMHFDGVGVEKSDVEAFAYWKRVMDRSDDAVHKTISTYMVGLCYYLGVGTEKDLVTGWKLINESKSDEFVLGGQWAFDWYWGQPIDKIQSSSRVSKVFFEHVKFGSANNILMKHLEAVCCFYGVGTNNDQMKAVEIFMILANIGFAVSQVMLGSCYFDGYVIAKSHEKAVAWYQKATDQGYACAEWALGCCYYDGVGVLQDHVKAVGFYIKAAEQGHGDAQYGIGDCYRCGVGVTKDYGKAVEWFRKAADQGNVDAQYELGRCYESGKGVTKDDVKAVEWFQKAADQGYARARDQLRLLHGDSQATLHESDKPISGIRKILDVGIFHAHSEPMTFTKNPISWLKRQLDHRH